MPARIRPLILALAAATLFATQRSASACILEFRSIDAQVAASPLVLIGKITQITPTPIPPEAIGLYPQGLPRPATATVAVVKVLKGPPDVKTLKISSGPLRSCAPVPVHADFVKGQTCIFIVSEETHDLCQLRWTGSMRELADLPAVEDSVARCQRWRSEYLQRIGKNSPEISRFGEKLDQKLVKIAKNWPEIDSESQTPAEILHGTTANGPLKAAADEVLALLKDADPAAVQTALALDFGCSSPWSNHPVWQQACTQYVQTHAPQLAALQHAEWLRLLQLAGGTSKQFAAYLARIAEFDGTPQLSFPNAPPPTPFVALRGESLTTDFLLRSQDFDRGLLYYAYGATTAALATLDPERVKDLLPVMCGDSNEHLKWAASTAIEQMPGDRFVGVLVDEFIGGESDFLLGIETSPRQDEHLGPILADVQKRLPAAQQAQFWKQLAVVQCFSPVCVDRGRAASRAPAPVAADPKDRRQYQAAVADYLGAAKAYIKQAQLLFEAQSLGHRPRS